MKRTRFRQAEEYMQQCMQHSVHDTGHVYRVVYTALRLLKNQPAANAEVVVLAALLHDIGRKEAAGKKGVSHAAAGAAMAYDFMMEGGWPKITAEHVRDCISTHSHKAGLTPATLEAKLLYDADKLDLTGAVGTARALLFGAEISEPLYRVGRGGLPTKGKKSEPPSLLREYRRKLRHMESLFYTKQAKKIARKRQKAMDAWFTALRDEVTGTYEKGTVLLDGFLRD